MKRSSRIQLGLVVACLLFWLAILAWTVVTEPGHPPDYLEDRAFPTAAEPVCAAAMAEVETFGNGAESENPEERADLVDRQDEVFTAMVADLRSLAMPAGREGEIVTEWLGDWETHISDRREWAADLHAGDDHAFVETAKGNNQVSEAVDAFATTNEMPSCATLNDV